MGTRDSAIMAYRFLVTLSVLFWPTVAGKVHECDVLVLGGGLSGLSAAWRLVAESTPPATVCLLEASDRWGGRTKDHHYTKPGCNQTHVVELGAQWIAQQEVDSDVWDLALNVLNLGIFNGWPWALYGFPYGPAHTDPKVKARLDRVPSVSSAGFNQGKFFFGPEVAADDVQAPLACQQRVAKAYDSIVLGEPWKTDEAAELDSHTPLEWLALQGCNITRDDVIAQGLNQVDISDPTILPPAFYLSVTSASSSGQEIFWLSSALWWLHAVKSNSGPVSMAVDVQRYRIVGGPQQMSQLLALKLQKAGALLKLSTPVEQIWHSKDGVRFGTADGQLYKGRYAIVTGTPVALSTHISWTPALHSGVAHMLKSARIGNYNKHYAFFDQGPELWRQNKTVWDGIQARTVQWPMVYASLPPLDPAAQQMPNGTSFFPSAIIDNSPASQVPSSSNDPECPATVGALFSFGWPKNASTAAERAAGWTDVLRGVPGLPAPSSTVGQAWAEEKFVMGAYGAWWPPNVISVAQDQWSALPSGRVFFAGTEWSEVGSGYMNGAIHNGRKHGSIVAKLLHP